MHLIDWIKNYQLVPCQLGVNDCCLALADWAVANGYADGATDLRDAYDNEKDMYSIIAQYGDLVGMVDHCALRAGVSETDHRILGTIAVIGHASNLYRQWGAIWDGSRWQVRLKDGFLPVSAVARKMWHVEIQG